MDMILLSASQRVVIGPDQLFVISSERINPAGDKALTQQIIGTGHDEYAIELDDYDFETGSPKQKRNIRLNSIFTCDTHVILYSVGHINIDLEKDIYLFISDYRNYDYAS